MSQPRLDLDLSRATRPGTGRRPMLGSNGAVATSQPLAAGAGMSVLQQGGSAVDAAIAMAACLTVVEPTSNGLGGDAFALVWDDGELHGLNGSGRAPAALTTEVLRGRQAVPELGWPAVTVPGQIRAWADLHERFGRLTFEQVLEPAISYAENGFPVSPVVSQHWARAAAAARLRTGPEFAGWGPAFIVDGEPPKVGQLWCNPDQAQTLRAIASSRGSDFYQGDLARRIARFSSSTGGFLTEHDLVDHRSEWVAPISTAFGGYRVWEIPPSGQGIAALLALNLLSDYELSTDPDDPLSWHLQIECMKLAMTDAAAHVADVSSVPTQALLSSAYADDRRRSIGATATHAVPGDPDRSGTVYLCAADQDGQMVSFIQSNYMGFGSGVVVPGTGISLHNRGCGFTLETGHPNELKPRKRPFHTIIPGFLTRDENAVGPFGVMGGHMQPQGHLQVVLHTLVHRDDPQRALDRPRWRWDSGNSVVVEPDTPQQVCAELLRRGHDLRIEPDLGAFGRGQIIWRLNENTVIAGSESRADGLALVR